MSRSRPGSGDHVGSTNPPIHIGQNKPRSPVIKHIWIDTDEKSIKLWTGSTWLTVATI